MIKYDSGLFGFQMLLRLHGSAVFKALTPSILSSCLLCILYYIYELTHEDDVFQDPYPLAVLISALTFLLAFRANFSYNRYWEAFTAVHHMHSNWVDVGVQLAAFHLQSDRYKKPPAFGAHPDLVCLERERERLHVTSLAELQEKLHQDEMEQREEKMKNNVFMTVLSGRRFRASISSRSGGREKRGSRTSDKGDSSSNKNDSTRSNDIDSARQFSRLSSPQKPKSTKTATVSRTGQSKPMGKSINLTNDPTTLHQSKKGQQELGPRIKVSPFSRNSADPTRAVTSVRAMESSQTNVDSKTPPLFLQESAHLLSLLSAVAMSTLRNDSEQASSPLISFRPGAPWPHVDPDDYGADVRKDWDASTHRTYTVFRYMMGMSRSPHSRTLYNAARPFRVIGGVSDAEVELLQAARGPLAKVALCTMWLQEFISRECLAGSTGKVAPPILSRMYQNVSDGMAGYNHARKVAYIPFPFPHAQITSLFVLIFVALMPILMLSYLTNVYVALSMNLLTVMCFTGLHEVARELESPFQNVPNDVPLNNFQAQFNEALMTMFAGYHPDAYWEVYETVKEPPLPSPPFPGKSDDKKARIGSNNDGDGKNRDGLPETNIGAATPKSSGV